MHTRLHRRLALVLALGAFGSTELEAQAPPTQPISFELRGGLSLPTGALSRGQRGLVPRVGLSTGFVALFRVHRSLSIYGGWSRHGFDCDETSECSPDSEISSSGTEVGARIVLPHRTRAVPWLRIGISFHRFRYVLDDVDARSDRAPGLDLGGGVDVPVGRFITLTPGLRFGYYESDLDLATFNAGAEPFTSAFLVVDLGGRLHF